MKSAFDSEAAIKIGDMIGFGHCRFVFLCDHGALLRKMHSPFSAFFQFGVHSGLLSAGRGTRSQTCIEGIDVEFNDAKIRETLDENHILAKTSWQMKLMKWP